MSDRANKTNAEIAEARQYLETGGLGEVIGFTDAALMMQQPKVQMDTTMAMALCQIANEYLARRAAH